MTVVTVTSFNYRSCLVTFSKRCLTRIRTLGTVARYCWFGKKKIQQWTRPCYWNVFKILRRDIVTSLYYSTRESNGCAHHVVVFVNQYHGVLISYHCHHQHSLYFVIFFNYIKKPLVAYVLLQPPLPRYFTVLSASTSFVHRYKIIS